MLYGFAKFTLYKMILLIEIESALFHQDLQVVENWFNWFNNICNQQIDQIITFSSRFYTYSAIKEQYFLIDFCYFLNISTWLQTMACPCESYSEECEIWFKANFVLAMGPISFAIITWQNSLVFHSVDKVTSFALHIMPGKVWVKKNETRSKIGH